MDFYRNLTNGRRLIDPILRIEEIADLVTDDKILNFAEKLRVKIKFILDT